MSQENVDLVLAFHAAYHARDIDAAVDLCATGVEVFPDASVFVESDALVGRGEFRVLLEDSWAPWESCVAKTEEVLEIGDGRVLVRGDWGGTGIAKVEYPFEHSKALQAVGREE